jgi:phage terminase large subunit
LQVIGANDPNALRGPNPVGVVFSEFAEQSPMGWQVLKPIVIENGGWAVFNFTPRGNNHAFDLYDEALGDPNWFASLLTVDDTGVLSAEQLAEARKGQRGVLPPGVLL